MKVFWYFIGVCVIVFWSMFGLLIWLGSRAEQYPPHYKTGDIIRAPGWHFVVIEPTGGYSPAMGHFYDCEWIERYGKEQINPRIALTSDWQIDFFVIDYRATVNGVKGTGHRDLWFERGETMISPTIEQVNELPDAR